MRKITILCLLLACVLPAFAGTYRSEQIPNVQLTDRRRYVSDPDGILSSAAVAHIDSVCASLRDRGLAQVAVVAVDDIAGGDPFSFAIDLFRRWGVGSSASDNGLGILLVKDLREIRFVTGGGLEGILPDALCKRIQLDRMLPAFRKGDYSAGMVAGVEAAATVLEGGEVTLANDEGLPAWMIFTIVFGFVVFPLGGVLANYYFSRRCPKCRKLALKQHSQRVLSVTRNSRLVEYTYICPHCGEVVTRRSRNLRDDNFGGGAGGGTILGGDFGRGMGGGFGGGSFGGGSFGGGGSGSRW
ncbi:YgcG family protein [Alistipes sp.]|uniref:TPM domain-containing protein n=1 Tax=Alistipes sp. TaxID=1872444 RepID=UPI0025BD47B4|nr:TPM domain-containing protein [Alistipes sp.]